MEDPSFFDESKDQSKVKAEIVSKYFYAWAKIIIPRSRDGKVAYIDLYCGPGKYKDGTVSTPLLILEKAILYPEMRDKVVTVFNDKEPKYVRSLKAEANKLPEIEKLKFQPTFLEDEVEEEMTKMFEETSLVPSLIFVDPVGYKGLSVKLLSALIKDWGCDTIFFFNYNRVNMNLNNPVMEKNMNTLFGKERADEVRKMLKNAKSAKMREQTIISNLKDSIKERGGYYFLPFKFRKGRKTSHFIIFVSKNVLGYTIMKGIMAKHCICDEDGVPTFEHDAAPKPKSKQLVLFSVFPSSSLDKLGEILVEDFKGQTISVRNLIDRHQIDKNYIEKNYKDALKRLEKNGRIRCNPPADGRKKDTLGDSVMISFPMN